MANILLFDLETSPLHAYAWQKYDTNLLHITRYSEILTMSWKSLGEKKPHSMIRKDLYQRVDGDKGLCRSLHSLIEDADMIVGHNADGFDSPVANARFQRHGIQAPADVPVIDTLKIARKYFKFPGNSLNDLAQYLGLPGKKETGGKDLWLKCMEGDKAAFKKMREYNEHDVVLLEQVFKKLVSFSKNIPNLNLLDPGAQHGQACPNPACLGTNTVKNGLYVGAKGRQQKHSCYDCGHRFKVAVKKEKKK